MATDFPANPSNGDIHAGFTYNSTTGAWESVPLGINALTDVDTNTNAPTTGQLLQWNGTNWVPYTHTNGITEIDVWRLTTNQTAGDTDPITGTWVRDQSAYTGTGMTQSSGIFTFPSTGVYRITYQARLYVNNTDSITLQIKYSVDSGSNYSVGSDMNFSEQIATGTGLYPTVNCEYLFNVTNTSTHKVKFSVYGLDTNNYMYGNTSYNRSWVSFLRLGDSQ